MKKIYINGRFLTQRITGVQRYAIEITKVLDNYLNDDKSLDVTILYPKNIIQKLELKNIKKKQVGYLRGHLWEQLELPFYSIDGFLLNMCNCAPLIKKNQAVTIHDAAVCAVPEAYSFKFRTWYKFMYRVLGYRLNTIFTVSNFSKKELHRCFDIDLSKIYVTYNGIDHILKIKPDESIFKKFDIKKKNYVLAVSSLNPSKNFKLILETAAKMPETNFIIAGGSNSSVFKQQGMKVTDNVKFIGYVTDNELVALYRNAFCFVYPSLYEGFGIPPMEAIMFNCPTVVSSIEIFKEIYDEYVLYCTDIHSLILKIKDRKSLDNMKKVYINKKIDVQEKYSWKNNVNIILTRL